MPGEQRNNALRAVIKRIKLQDKWVRNPRPTPELAGQRRGLTSEESLRLERSSIKREIKKVARRKDYFFRRSTVLQLEIP